MSKRVDKLKSRILLNIRDGVPGFCESLPSLREQTLIFNETHHVVNMALKELEEENIIRCIPYKGYKILAQAAKPVKVEVSGESSVIHVLITENLVWQIDFWCRCIKIFEEMYPGNKVMPYFIAEKKAISALLKSINGDSVVLIGDLSKIDKREVMLIPRPEIARVSGTVLSEDDFLADMIDPLDACSIPYQIQPPLLFCRATSKLEKYNPDAGYEAFLDWVVEAYGSHALAPLNMPLFFDSLGIGQIYALTEEQIHRKLKLLLKLAVKMKEENILHMELPDDVSSDMKLLAAGQLQCTIRGSFCAGAANFPRTAGEIAILPPPEETDGRLIQPVSRMAVAGTSCSQGAAAFFHFILGQGVQLQIMKEGLGISPFRSIAEAAVKDADQFGYDIGSVIRYVERECRKAPGLHDNELCHECAAILIDNLLIPVLSGSFDGNKNGLLKELTGRLYAIGEGRHQERRSRNLREYFMRNF